jgi:outer membrane protein TolC
MNALLLALCISTGHAETPASAEARSLLLAMSDLETDERNTVARGTWWQEMGDASLPDLVRAGLRNNPNIRSMDARLILAKANTWQSLAGMLPTVSVDLQGQIQPTDGLGLSPFSSSMPDYGAAFQSLAEMMAQIAQSTGQDPATFPSLDLGSQDKAPDTYTQGSLMLNAQLPIDWSTRQLHGYLASRHEVAAAGSGAASQRARLASQVADTYFDLLAARQQVAVLQAQAAANRDLLELVRMRYEGGQGTALDVLQQRQQLAGTEALLPRAEGQAVAATRALNALLGRAPSTPIPTGTPLPEIGTTPAMPRPTQLMVDRPELAQAIAKLDASRLQRTAAWLGLTPTLGLTGSVGKQYLKMDETDSVDTWSVGAALSVPLFSGGRTHAGIRAATAQQRLANEALRGQVLTVIQQLGTAQTQDKTAGQALRATHRQLEAAADAFAESQARYQDGLLPYINVLVALNAHQRAELAWLDAQRAHLRARVQLHTAVGGSWSRFTSETSP